MAEVGKASTVRSSKTRAKLAAEQESTETDRSAQTELFRQVAWRQAKKHLRLTTRHWTDPWTLPRQNQTPARMRTSAETLAPEEAEDRSG